VRALGTGSHIVFARLSSPKHSVPVAVSLRSASGSYSLHPFHLKSSPTYSKVWGVDRSSGPWGWVGLSGGKAADGNVFVSKAYIYKDLKKTYGNGKSSSVKQLVSEKDLLSVGRTKNHLVSLSFGMATAKNSCERYFLLTGRSIVDTGVPQSRIATVSAAEVKWLAPDGSFAIAPYSIEPATKEGFVRSLLYMRGDQLLDAYKQTNSSLLQDLLLNNEYSLGLIRSSDGLWRTNYTSTWVKSESHIVAPYVDTRHNEAIALASSNIATALVDGGYAPAQGIAAWSWPYWSFLSGRASAGAVVHTAHGFYLSDYYDADGKAKCHASLNHSLGELNYLLTQSGDSSSTPQFALAMNIKSAVDDSGVSWIAPDSDLWYQRNLDGSFGGTDYRTVTYYDLLNSQSLLETLTGSRDAILDQLIASKAQFLNSTGTSVPVPTLQDRLATSAAGARRTTPVDVDEDRLP